MPYSPTVAALSFLLGSLFECLFRFCRRLVCVVKCLGAIPMVSNFLFAKDFIYPGLPGRSFLFGAFQVAGKIVFVNSVLLF